MTPHRIPSLLPIHGFVLAGGRSTRMGQDKALLPFLSRPMIEIAVEKLRTFCADVSIAGNRDDLARFAPIVHETRLDAGPGAGIEAGLKASSQPWVLFIPVDVPLVPAELLHNWAVAGLDKGQGNALASFLIVARERQPAFSLWRTSCLPAVTRTLDAGNRRLNDLLDTVHDSESGWLWPVDAAKLAPARTLSAVQLEFWFSNVNTPQELAEAEAWAASPPGPAT